MTDPSPRRIVFISAHEFGMRALVGLLKSRAARRRLIDVALILTVRHPETVATVGMQYFDALAKVAQAEHRFLRTVKGPSVEGIVASAEPDFLLAIGLSELIPPTVLDLPALKNGVSERHSASHGVIGMHPTLLPVGRGRAPIPWTILHGLSKTGVTAFRLEDEPDVGDIIAQAEYVVSPGETSSTLYAKAARAHQELGCELAELIATGEVLGQKQDERKASAWPRRRPVDSAINFHRSAQEIDRLVRAQTHPYPSAYFRHAGAQVFVDAVEHFRDEEQNRPGLITFVDSGGRPTIACGDGVVLLTRMRPDQLVTFIPGTLVNPS